MKVLVVKVGSLSQESTDTKAFKDQKSVTYD